MNWYRVATMALLLTAIVIAYIGRIQSTSIALFAIMLCVVYITSGWIYVQYYNLKFDDNNDCIIGTTKLKQGVLHGGCIDIWHVYHLIFWTLIGILLPHRYLTVFAMSIAWELCEYFVFRISQCKASFCGRVEDIMLNMIGYAFGSFLAHRM